MSSRGTDSFVTQIGVSSLGADGPRVGWAVNALGVYLTTNGGRYWRNVTPPLLARQSPGDRVDSMTVRGTNDIWISVHDVFGLVSPAQARVTGSVRAQGIFRSTDGGRTWAFSSLPGCLQSCGADIELSFVSADVGFALLGPTNSPTLRLYDTRDGGANWTLVAQPPFHGDNTAIAFATARDGWAATNPTYGRYAETGGPVVSDPGGVLYRTTDGGQRWERVSGLPRFERLQLPVVLGPRTAVALGQDPRHGERGRATVYVTENGGASWQAHRGPTDAHLSAYLHHDLGVDAPPLSVSSPRQWSMFVGPVLYRTDDAGVRWVGTRTTPSWSPGAVLVLALGPGRRGLAEAYVPDCVPMKGVGPCVPLSAPLLEVTTDGGSTWRALDYWRPPPGR